MAYEHLFSPITLRNTTFQSRVMMGSMHVGLEGEENGIEKLTAFYVRRAKEHVGLIVTGGAAVTPEGSGGENFMMIADDEDIKRWKPLTEAVHEAGGKIALQLFHAGRYAYKSMNGTDPVAPSPIKSPINPDEPKEMNVHDIYRTIQAFADSAKRAKEAGFDAVEIMGSEGYLINQFISPVTNQRTDQWGGTFENRLHFPLAIARLVREYVGLDYPVIFRMSGLDLIEDSTTEEQTLTLAEQLESSGIDMLNIGIGWHESNVPTISMKVPRNHFTDIAENIKNHVSIPVIASNRINQTEDAEKILAEGKADMISMARPFLADPEILTKAKQRREDDINTCIACNQACLDHVFENKPASCIVNPEAGRELVLTIEKAKQSKQILVVGAGPAGLETARVAALRGHKVTIADKRTNIGGQFNYSLLVPGKAEFNETIRYYKTQLDKLGVHTVFNTSIDVDHPLAEKAEDIVIATGIIPREPDIPGLKESGSLAYPEVFEETATVSGKVAIIGGGGIACDLASFLYEKGHSDITLFQRSTTFGRGIGKTTRWATLLDLKKKGIHMVGGVTYKEVTTKGLCITLDDKEEWIEVDTIITASGQLPNPSLYKKLSEQGKAVHIVGGASQALGLNAEVAIYDGTKIGRSI
ncbi:NADPH-dependent 2,4-dienoyl-CoA reductase [Salibacterium salarium]|uniref:NADPH-dependent 2,4-dienoyl-CoA reductase n=1 Tax=Salibacterium salarium TaxID=284579 RepID=A0A428MUQ7_9BACI|nr:FAD-dependent oxidoreductase [Salibacterium salarium]RSL29875.1 NADPH-dependent 2,4-dienoyl-CoA reductase [Salibacterium salarium]